MSAFCFTMATATDVVYGVVFIYGGPLHIRTYWDQVLVRYSEIVEYASFDSIDKAVLYFSLFYTLPSTPTAVKPVQGVE